jgi:hypothetical protein
MSSIIQRISRLRPENSKSRVTALNPSRGKQKAWIVLCGVGLWSAGLTAGCGGSSDSGMTPEVKEKQAVVQEKMRDFMQNKAQAGKKP